MGEKVLYKYLDIEGAKMMLYYKTLMFTNATHLNDPFDCHPCLFDYSNVPEEQRRVWGKDAIIELEANRFERTRDKAYICSLSKVHDSLLMWSYYNKHKGICLGLDMEKTRPYLSRMWGLMMGCMELEVKYKDILEKPDYFSGSEDFFYYQMTTKGMAWKHEQEVRLISYDPSPVYMKLLPGQTDKDGPIDWKTVRAFLEIGGDCFESIYLGVSIADREKAKIIDFGKRCNPSIKIYQMQIDPKAFRVKGEAIE